MMYDQMNPRHRRYRSVAPTPTHLEAVRTSGEMGQKKGNPWYTTTATTHNNNNNNNNHNNHDNNNTHNTKLLLNKA